jgi:malate dehydrogenase (oxaloacetate-decarboxylating)(NADP+)
MYWLPTILEGNGCGATKINEEMKLAATHALANLLKEPVPEQVNMHGELRLNFGRLYYSQNP